MPNISRATALGAATAAVVAAPVLFERLALAASKADPADIKLLNTAVPLERAAVKAYADADATNLLSPQARVVLKSFMADHQAHLDALVAAVAQGGATPSPDTATIPVPTLANELDILNYAYTIERLAASTYLSTIALFKNRDLATTAAAIMGVETTHVALLAEALKKNPAYPSSFVSA